MTLLLPVLKLKKFFVHISQHYIKENNKKKKNLLQTIKSIIHTIINCNNIKIA